VMTESPRVLVSCVGESTAEWSELVQMLALSLRQHGGAMSGAPVVANFVDRMPEVGTSEMAALDIEMRVVPRFDASCPWANKLRMLEMSDLGDFDVLLALDCDVAIMGDLSSFLSTRMIRAAVDTAKIDDAAWQYLFESFNLDLGKNVEDPYGRATWPYFNSGVLSIPTALCHDLQRRWSGAIESVRPLLNARPSLHSQRDYLDQIALAVALQTGGFDLEPLPHNVNCFTGGFMHGRRIALSEPFVLHYHGHRDPRGFLRRSGNAVVDEHINRFNQDRAAFLGLSYRRPSRREFSQWMLRRSSWTRRMVQGLSRTKGRAARMLGHAS
jgi:hypothetical protein